MDIALCVGLDCPLKENCLRFKAESNEMYQSYFTEPPVKENECEFFIDCSQNKLL